MIVIFSQHITRVNNEEHIRSIIHVREKCIDWEKILVRSILLYVRISTKERDRERKSSLSLSPVYSFFFVECSSISNSLRDSFFISEKYLLLVGRQKVFCADFLKIKTFLLFYWVEEGVFAWSVKSKFFSFIFFCSFERKSFFYELHEKFIEWFERCGVQRAFLILTKCPSVIFFLNFIIKSLCWNLWKNN